MKNIEVSVVCITYNHEKYIEKCIQSLLEQETGFEYEIIIHDDASSDGTAKIVKEYAERHPDKIVPILQNENITSKGIGIMSKYIFPIAKGKYIATCEGDDYWCCKSKLQKQYEALKNNPDCGLSVHATQCVNEQGENIQRIFPEVEFQKGVINNQKIIDELPTWLFHYSSYFFEKEMYLKIANEEKEFYKLFPVGDIRYLYLFILYSDIYYYTDIMSCYRTQAAGSWTTRFTKEKEKEFCERMLQVTKKFTLLINQRRKELSMNTFEKNAVWYYEFRLHVLNQEYSQLLRKKYRKFFNEFSLKFKVKIVMMALYRMMCKWNK